MDHRLRYELTISDKVEALPLPDMADMIWKRIEHQLDTDMPSEDGSSGGDSPFSPSPSVIIGGSVFVFLIAFISFFFIFKNNKNEQPASEPIPSSTETIKQDDKTPAKVQEERSARKPGRHILVPTLNKRSDSTFVATDSVMGDSAHILSDSTVRTEVPVIPEVRDSIQRVKKRRGVSALTDSDYKIVPKNDSSK